VRACMQSGDRAGLASYVSLMCDTWCGGYGGGRGGWRHTLMGCTRMPAHPLKTHTHTHVQVLDVGDEDLMANAFAEASILDSLRGWPGCVQMLACGRTDDNQVRAGGVCLLECLLVTCACWWAGEREGKMPNTLSSWCLRFVPKISGTPKHVLAAEPATHSTSLSLLPTCRCSLCCRSVT